MDEKKIERINELYRKSKSEGLTPAEAKEQQELRAAYIATIRGNMKSQLNQVSLLNPDGTVTELSKKNVQ